MIAELMHPQAVLGSSPTLAHSMKVTDEAENEILSSDEADETRNGSANTSNCEENLQQDIQLILQEHFDNVIKKWGNSEQ